MKKRYSHEPIMTGFETCVSCFEKLDISEFSICRSKKNGRKSICKKCDSFRECARIAMIKAKKRPEKYLMCDDCDYVFYRYKTASSTMRNNKDKVEKDKCPKCKSKNIVNF